MIVFRARDLQVASSADPLAHRARGHLQCKGSVLFNMKTISITIDEPLLGHLDQAAQTARKTRSELFRFALREWLDDQRRRRMVAEDRAAYEIHPVRPDEFEGLIAAQAAALQEAPEPRDEDDW